MKDIVRLTLSLMLIGLVSGLAVGVTHLKTRTTIEEQQMKARQEALALVLPEGTTVEDRTGGGELPPTYWTALADGHPVAYAFEAASRGYGDDIEMMVGVDTAGTILGISILSQSETPGLGTRVAEVVSKRYVWNGFGGEAEISEPWFTEQFEGVDLDEKVELTKSGEWHALTEAERAALLEKNRVTAITGATISSSAVLRGLNTVVFPYLQALREGNSQ